jgi:hypothetical protein
MVNRLGCGEEPLAFVILIPKGYIQPSFRCTLGVKSCGSLHSSRDRTQICIRLGNDLDNLHNFIIIFLLIVFLQEK